MRITKIINCRILSSSKTKFSELTIRWETSYFDKAYLFLRRKYKSQEMQEEGLIHVHFKSVSDVLQCLCHLGKYD